MFVPYKGTGKSNIVEYELAPDGIRVRFKGGATYLYTGGSAGLDHITEMHRLAVAGEGLAAYINKHVRKLYHSKEV